MLTGMQLPDPRTPMSMPAGSTHARVHAHWIYACTHSQGTHTCMYWAHACTHAPGPCMLAHTGPHACSLAQPMHAHSHQVPTPLTLGPTPTRSQGPPPCLVSMHARTGSGSPCLLAHGAHLTCTHRVPMPARSQGPYTHTHQAIHAHLHQAPTPTPTRFPCTHACTGHMYACLHVGSLHACIRPMHARLHRAPHAHSLAGSPCTCAGSLHSCMLHPMLYVVVICSSSTVLYSSIMQ